MNWSCLINTIKKLTDRVQELDVDDPLEGSGLLGGVDEGVRPLNLELGRRFEVVLQLNLKKKIKLDNDEDETCLDL